MNRSSKAPTWLKVIIIILLVILIAGTTVASLYILLPNQKNASVSITSSQPKVANAQKLVEAYQASGDIKDRDSLYKVLATNPTNTYVQYKNNNQSYGIIIAATQHIQYQRLDTTKTNSANLASSTETFLDNLGISKTSEQNLGTFISKLFEGPTVICQTDDRQAVGQQPATYGLACIDKSAADLSYAHVDVLAKASKGALQTNKIKTLTETDITQAANNLTTLITSNNDNSSTTYYFLSTDQTNWSYIGERPTPSADVKDSFQIPPQLQDTINSSQYRDFLTTYIK